jgi:hypothetical protein
MLDGEPLTDALVLFEAADRSFSYGKTDGDGRYRLMFNSEKSGVSKGTKTVRIWSSLAVPGVEEMDADGDAPIAGPEQPERVPASYNVRSTLSASVEQDSHTFDFDLRS